MKNIKPKNIIWYTRLITLLIIFTSLGYLYIFLKNNIYDIHFFDYSKYSQTNANNKILNLNKFNQVIEKINNKKKSSNRKIKNFFQ